MLGLIRPYLKCTAYHYALKVQKETSATLKILQTAEGTWAYGSILHEAWTRLYTEWENNIKIYLKDQRQWNGLEDNFDWSVGDTDTIDRVTAALKCFGVVVSIEAINEIRKTKSFSANDYLLKSQQVKNFWLELEKFEVFKLRF